MGIFWSCCEDNEDVCIRCSRRGLPLVNNECTVCRNSRQRAASHISSIQNHSRTSLPAYHNRPRRATPTTVARPKPVQVAPRVADPKRPLFGEFRCTCGRRWKSRRSWHGRYQICKSCRKSIFAHTQRELRTDDIDDRNRDSAMKDHPTDLCQMCMELGYYCGRYK